MGSPAHAGIDRLLWEIALVYGRFPRTRGDRPQAVRLLQWLDTVPPHTRG